MIKKNKADANVHKVQWAQLHVQSPVWVSHRPADCSKNSRAAARLTQLKTRAPPAAGGSLMQREIIKHARLSDERELADYQADMRGSPSPV